MSSWWHDFHFLRPWFLLLLPVLWLMLWWLAQKRTREGDWSQVIDQELLPALYLESADAPGMRPWPWLALLWTLAALALAGPSWQRDMTQAYQLPADWVLMLDLSPSMQATDLAPDRVTRAHYALDDLLDAVQDARVGLVAFSDEAYTVAPLTRDVATISALLPPLQPDIMPSAGDRLAPALQQAEKLFQPGTNNDKRIVLLTDGCADPASALAAIGKLRAHGVTLDVVGVGTAKGAPLLDEHGHFVKDAHGQSQLSKLDVGQLQQFASSGGGQYVDISQLPSLIASLKHAKYSLHAARTEQGVEVAHWRDAGVWLLPLLLLLAAALARRNWL